MLKDFPGFSRIFKGCANPGSLLQTERAKETAKEMRKIMMKEIPFRLRSGIESSCEKYIMTYYLKSVKVLQ